MGEALDVESLFKHNPEPAVPKPTRKEPKGQVWTFLLGRWPKIGVTLPTYVEPNDLTSSNVEVLV